MWGSGRCSRCYRSRPGEGTRFEVALPRAAGVAAEPEPAAAPTRAATGGRLLLVDDDPDFGDMLLMALERRGFEVAPCADPQQALDGFAAHPDAWDAVVTDQTLPGMSGLDLIRAIKAVHPDLPCVLCSGYAENLTDRDLREAGVLRLMPKPIDIDELVDVLVRAIGRV